MCRGQCTCCRAERCWCPRRRCPRYTPAPAPRQPPPQPPSPRPGWWRPRPRWSRCGEAAGEAAAAVTRTCAASSWGRRPPRPVAWRLLCWCSEPSRAVNDISRIFHNIRRLGPAPCYLNKFLIMRNCVDSCTELSRSLWLRSSLSSSPGSAWPLQVPGLMLASILGLGPHTTITIPVSAPLRTHTQSPPFISELCGATVRNPRLWNKIWLNYLRFTKKLFGK